MSLSGKYWARKLREAFFRGRRKRSLTHVPEHLWLTKIDHLLVQHHLRHLPQDRKVPQPSVSAAAWTPAPKMGVRLRKWELTDIAAALRVPLASGQDGVGQPAQAAAAKLLGLHCYSSYVLSQIRKCGNYLCSCHLDVCGTSQGGTAVSDLYRKFQCAAINKKNAIFKRNVIVKGSSPVLGSPFTDILTSGTALPYE